MKVNLGEGIISYPMEYSFTLTDITEYREMTIREIEKELGYKIKIKNKLTRVDNLLARYKIEDLRDEAVAQGWELISAEYKNLDTDLEYRCDKGHPVYTSYKKIRKNYVCPLCKEFNGSTEMEIAIKPISKPKGAYRVLSLDQSSKVSGFAIFDNDTLIQYGSIEITGANAPIRFVKVREWVRHG